MATQDVEYTNKTCRQPLFAGARLYEQSRVESFLSQAKMLVATRRAAGQAGQPDRGESGVSSRAREDAGFAARSPSTARTVPDSSGVSSHSCQSGLHPKRGPARINKEEPIP